MTEILSQKEIDALLNSISSGETDTDDYRAVGEQRKVRIVDFRRNDFLSKRQIRNLQVMHEMFARHVSVSLSAQLDAVVFMHVGSVDQLTYEEFVRCIPNPTNCSVISMDPLRGSAILEIDPSVTFSILNLLYGGDGNVSGVKDFCRRIMTEIEMSTMEGQIVRMLGCMREAWSNLIDLRPRLGDIEPNPQMLLLAPPNEMCVLITIETRIGDLEGMMNILYPMSTLRPIMHKLKDHYDTPLPPSDEWEETPLDFPMRVRYGFQDVFVPFGSLPRMGDTIVLGKVPQFHVRYNDHVVHVFKDSEIDTGKDKSDG